MNISEIYLFCSTTSPASKPCFAFIKENPLLIQEIQIIRLDTKNHREMAKRSPKFQIRVVPTLMVIYNDGDTSLYQGQKKVLTWLFMRMKTFEQAQAQASSSAYLSPHAQRASAEGGEELQRTPRPLPDEETGLYSSTPPQSLVRESEIEFLPTNPQPPQPPSQPNSSSSLDINARRQDKDPKMGDLVSAARKMEENRQSQLRTNDPPSAAPPPIKQF